ncbi:MAG: hypothetical protein KJ065_01325 [Anaerolineae bacterium]|nr:hypothetical protein [Anaerolineae bacterium]
MPAISNHRSFWAALGAALILAVIARALLLMSGSVSFHSDEAIVGLMARHILAGDRPTFFFGQAYMGSLDAWPVAIGFQVLGESVQTIRIVQSSLYLLVVASAYYAAWVLSHRIIVALVTALTFAVASPLLALYTTATLGGYNETLIFGHLLVALGFGAQMGYRPVDRWRWGAMGLIAGAGWWANALIVVYALPVGIYLLWRLWKTNAGAPRSTSRIIPILIGLAGFVIGSAPWWIYALQNDLTPIRFFLPEVFGGREIVGAVIPTVSLETRLVGLFLFGLPAVVGARFPWAGDYFAPVAGMVVAAIFLFALAHLARQARANSGLRPGAPALLWGIILVLCALFLLTRFASDPSGRYFLPLTLPLGIALGTLAASMPRKLIGLAFAAVPLLYFAAGQVVAASTPPGFTTQFVAQTHLPNTDDARLIAWFEDHHIEHGYTTYWLSFRLAFLSGERLRFSAALPDKSSLDYTPAFERYPPYREATDQAEQIAYLVPSINIPELDAALIGWFGDQGVTFQSAQVGDYRIYYDFQPFTPRPPLPFLQGA